ncbi:NUDIX domain-containing protein [Jeotgalibacillus campisalis]|uniref:NUDIX hydrolase n=1 Tax=Jeotgalibacillus campisalis TaxID=220754 RepID=A0A0C2V3Q9_9BACL|nr:NUDIX hydrolase [Jeotgalibacillus campisalis]KIL43672.1 NUDIX hydrolase [Jeotgalibacillus campisalis]
MKKNRGNVWLAAAGLVVNDEGEWLVVKKKYGGLRGVWSLPAGFLEAGETADQAAQREVFEETGVTAEIGEVIGLRSGVIGGDISDNLIIFSLFCKKENNPLQAQEGEIAAVQWMTTAELEKETYVSQMIPSMIQHMRSQGLKKCSLTNPGDHFNYTAYHLFLG